MNQLDSVDLFKEPNNKAYQENLRLKELGCHSIMLGEKDPSLDSITRFAVSLAGGDIGGISLVFHSEIWLPACVGLDISSVPRAGSFYTCVIDANKDGLYEVEDASLDPRFQTNPLVTSPEPFLQYAAVPLRGQGSYLFGTLWVMKHKPGRISLEQSKLFIAISKFIVEVLKLRYTSKVTGMSNRFVFLRRLQTQLQSSRVSETLVGYLDLVAFRQFNDSIGWDGANFLLKTLAQRLEVWTVYPNQAAHLDGDKFAFALSGSRADIREGMEDLAKILTHKISMQDGSEHSVHARIGFVFAVNFASYCAADLLDAAETASSTISRAIHFTSSREYSENMCLLAHDMSEFIAMLDGENGHGELVLYYQPQVSKLHPLN